MEGTNAERLLYATLFVLTFGAGLVDAASVLALGHVFTANMTGNVVFLGFAFAGVPEFSILRSSLALAAALVGGILAGNLDSRVTWRNRPTWLSVATLVEAMLVGAAALTAWRHPAGQNDLSICIMIILTGVAMGVRNGTVRRLGVPDLTTTVLTLTVAALAFDSRLAGGTGNRWHIRIAAILCMFAGAFVGASLLHHSLTLLLSVAAALSLLVALVHMFRDETEHEAKLVRR
jgi:uncharacterized membrane protein YoaK (UPF0700 family)